MPLYAFPSVSGHSYLGKGQVAGYKTPNSREGVTLLSRASGGLPIVELARLVLGVASAKALTRINIPKLSFRTWTDGDIKSALPL